MPFREATFWYGTILFTTGIYFWIVGGDQLTAGIALTVVGLAMSVYAVVAEHYTSLPKLRVWVALLLLTWVALGYDIYGRHHSAELREFDEPNQQKPLLFGVGMKAPDFCQVMANGNLLLPYKNDYNVGFACYLWDGTQDQLDAPIILFSEPRDIVGGDISMRVEFNQQFDWRFNHSEGMVNYLLMLVPKNVRISQFSTLRQARALKVRLVMLESRSIARKGN